MEREVLRVIKEVATSSEYNLQYYSSKVYGVKVQNVDTVLKHSLSDIYIYNS